VHDNPIASAGYQSTDFCDGGEIVLEGKGSGIEPLTYQWNGPNGFTSSQRNITISDVDESYNGLYTLTVNSQEYQMVFIVGTMAIQWEHQPGR